MIINHNIPALNTYRSLSNNIDNTSRSLAKLSSGMRINTAGDDAAGLAISEKMRSQIRGLNQAQRNALDGKSLLQTAEGALNEVHSILQRMKELSVQSANDTNTKFDRNEIQKEIEQLKTEIDRISRDTEFNTMKLLNGTMGRTAIINTTSSTAFIGKTSAGAQTGIERLTTGLKMEVVGIGLQAGSYTLTAVNELSSTAAIIADFKYSNITPNTIANGQGVSFDDGALYGNYRLDFTKNLGGSYDLTLKGPDGRYQIISARDDGTGSGGSSVHFTELGVLFTFGNGQGPTISGDGYVEFTLKADLSLKLDGPDGSVVNYTSTYAGGYVNIGGLQFELSVGMAKNAGEYGIVDLDDKSIKLHIGANQGQNMDISVLDSSSKALGINTLDLTTQKTADWAVYTVDVAINRVSSERSKMGAIMNRLDHTVNNLAVTSENLSASESRIRDVDMAKEVMEFTKNQILSQAAQSMLAQANQIPQGILQLLQ